MLEVLLAGAMELIQDEIQVLERHDSTAEGSGCATGNDNARNVVSALPGFHR
jgi:hypothetical protein